MDTVIQHKVKGKPGVVIRYTEKDLSISVNGKLKAGFIGKKAAKIYDQLVNNQANIMFNLN